MIPLEHLADGSISDRNFQKLMHLVMDTAEREIGIRFGVETLTWPGGSANSTNLTVSHGLGRTPIVVLAAGAGGITGSASYPVPVAFGYGASTFSLGAQTNLTDSPTTGNTTAVAWVAIG